MSPTSTTKKEPNTVTKTIGQADASPTESQTDKTFTIGNAGRRGNGAPLSLGGQATVILSGVLLGGRVKKRGVATQSDHEEPIGNRL